MNEKGKMELEKIYKALEEERLNLPPLDLPPNSLNNALNAKRNEITKKYMKRIREVKKKYSEWYCLDWWWRGKETNKCLCNKEEGDKMIIKQYDRVLMKDGSKASIVEIFEDKKSFIADIERNGDIDTEEISIDDIEKEL